MQLHAMRNHGNGNKAVAISVPDMADIVDFVVHESITARVLSTSSKVDFLPETLA